MAQTKIFSSALSRQTNLEKAVDEVSEKIKKELNGRSCDLLLFFISEGHIDLESRSAGNLLREKLSPVNILGCDSSGVIGDKKEVEMEPALSVLAMHLPNVSLSPFYFNSSESTSFESGKELIEFLDISPETSPKFICLADPLTTDVSHFLSMFNEAYPNAPVIGGLASATLTGGENWIYWNGELHLEGGAGVAFTGDIAFDIIVSQGCRPIGEPLTITKAEENILYELAGKSAMQVLQDVFARLSPQDQMLAQTSLFVGLAMDETRISLDRGDFLIRNITGADQNSGALAIGELLEAGQTLQFQVRDAAASKEDLEILLKKLCQKQRASQEGALLVSCCGRGKSLYGEADHDVKIIQSLRGPVPLTGFFANGEFGPVERRNYVHGYTSSLTILR